MRSRRRSAIPFLLAAIALPLLLAVLFGLRGGITWQAAPAPPPLTAIPVIPTTPLPSLPAPTATTIPAAYPTLEDYWNGTAIWLLDVADTGLPIGESDTLYVGDGEYWSYLHASYPSAGIRDSCGEPVKFPGCVTRWASADGGRTFRLAEPTCLLECNSCPCDGDDHPWQQQYPRVISSPGGGYYLTYEQGASAWVASSVDGLEWGRAKLIPGTGIWKDEVRPCAAYMRIGPHPFVEHDRDCMAGGPPGLAIDEGRLYVFVGLGQNPGHMGCYFTTLGSLTGFVECGANPLFDGSPIYGPFDALGPAANPFFDFRFVTSADVVKVGSYFYMAYEGIRGPHSAEVGRDTQFGLGFARSQRINSRWEKFGGNPALDGVIDNWGVGHADIVIVDGVTYLYTGTPAHVRGRYRLVFK